MLEVQYPMEVPSRAWDIEVYVQSSVKAQRRCPLSPSPSLPSFHGETGSDEEVTYVLSFTV